MKLLTIFGLIISLPSPCQGPVYTAVYRTEITSRPKYNFQNIEPKTKKDSILQEITQQLSEELQKINMTVSAFDTITVFNDSILIHTVPYHSDMNMQGVSGFTFNDSRSVFKNGKFYSIKKEENTIEWENRFQLYREINKSDTVLGYITRVYVSKDGTSHIWVCQNLSPLINPGVQILNPVGAILKYEMKEPDQTIISTLESFIKNRE